MVGIPEVHIQRHTRVTSADHRIVRDIPGEANAGLEVVIVAVVEPALGLDPAAYAAASRAGDRAGDRLGIIIVRRRQAAYAEPSRELTVDRAVDRRSRKR